MDFPAWPVTQFEARSAVADTLGVPVEWTGRTDNGAFLLALVADEGSVRDLSPDLGKVSRLDASVGLIPTAAADLGHGYDFVSRGVKENLDSACWELGQQWRADPRLGGREVEFSEYLATKLCNALRLLDRKQNRHLHDSHGAYQPDREPLEFDEFDGKYFPFVPATPITPEGATAANWTQSLEAAAHNAGIAQPSVAALIQKITNVKTGRIKSPYRLARAEGLTTTAARYQPATGPFIAIHDFIADATPTALATAIS